MKKVILLALLMPVTAFGQIVETFESGNLATWVQSTDDHWKADTAASLSGRFSLHHIFDNPDAGIDQIGVPIHNLHPSQGLTMWSFLVRHGYDPSSSNNWSVFLMSDNDPVNMSPDGNTNGFAIGVNLTGYDDTLRLWKVKGKEVTTVINSRINWQTVIGTTDAAKINVERSQEGNWTISVYSLNDNLIGMASSADAELFNPAWFGIYYKYSSTRDRLLWVDDISIEGNFYADNEAPVITGCNASGKYAAELSFDEEPADRTMVPENFSLNVPENKAVSVIKINNLIYRVVFSEMLTNRTLNNFIINNICDNSGNCAQNVQIGFTPAWAETGDVIISEIMADPVPEVSLPGKDYIEITNRTEYAFNLKNWKLSTGNRSIPFPETTIRPSGILIICALQDTMLFAKYGGVIGMKQFPSLTLGGELIYISDSSGTFIHGVEYSSEWYKDDLKSRGGWSLEMIDTRFPFYDQDNWIAAEAKKGGTPGSVNSVSGSNPDISFYGILNVFPDDSITIHVRFSEPVFNLPGKIKSITVGGKGISEIYPEDPLFRYFLIKLALPLQRAQAYSLELSEEIEDFAGNSMQKRNLAFGLPEQVLKEDILFNEILFNPFPGDPDYIELFNNSDKIIDASRLQLISINDATSDTSEIVSVSDEKRCIMPQTYYAITSDPKMISERYFSTDKDYLFKTANLPSMPDDKGHIVLYDRELDKIDEVFYNEKMHFSLLSNVEGVALEKIIPQNKSDETNNWHSATESSGWGTPGAPNSVFAEMPAVSDKIVFSSSKITPNNDGNEDFLRIMMNLKGNGNVISVIVFDEAGNYVRKISSNLYAGTEASVIWDGTSDDGSLVRTGIYIILITLYNDTGKTEQWKKVCTVIRN
ncbi:MAG: lamin tail domain-containing protein [Bacteroidales bacterium]